ncbi:hypothetical protein [Ligilactobacillus acidipiscis]|uniref:Uncharacterized protein n=1 Tax=Ligilactobacillus acidipiscis TaxID=89059 RepID=A0A921FAI3_9LACO|nr:hypothetical protein [Ligilactobacillus acidipiscis]MCI1925384.1 hypothetical protein [Ligilactobacillus acidipiscis]MCI1954303.1 hypothetical protein [Ligilactobacillus acidipiscis]WEV57246.1 hypothetical protein OZX66_01500 [Ligilactobacillus acidipiscis]HJE98044.1 hypothetical protein [Ligilactobacillus acidipiscis]
MSGSRWLLRIDQGIVTKYGDFSAGVQEPLSACESESIRRYFQNWVVPRS